MLEKTSDVFDLVSTMRQYGFHLHLNDTGSQYRAVFLRLEDDYARELVSPDPARWVWEETPEKAIRAAALRAIDTLPGIKSATVSNIRSLYDCLIKWPD